MAEEGWQGVQGVVLDADLLSKEGLCIDPRIVILLERLSYSNLHQGIMIKETCNSKKEMLLNHVVSGHMSVKAIPSMEGLCTSLKEFTSEWAVTPDRCVFLTDSLTGLLKDELLSQGWHICVTAEITSSDASPKIKSISSVYDVFYQIASINKALCQELILIAYTMKWSRERDLLRRGAFPIQRTNENLSFFPLYLDLPLPQQLAIVNMVLYKPTDEITEMESNNSEHRIKFTGPMEELISYFKMHPHVCVIDPIEKILPLLDRVKTQEILQSLPEFSTSQCLRIRPPRFAKLSKFDCVRLPEILKTCNVALPAIVKPQMACGVPDAHKMAIVFRLEGFTGLAVSIPAVIQEYVDHGSKIYKFYVIGTNVLYSVRKSTPNAASLAGTGGELHVPAAIVFDSLKSLPTSFIPDDLRGRCTTTCEECGDLDLELVHAAASWLREKLKITVFGFDVVVQLATSDHVIVDVNFLPTFKDVSKEEAIPALWEALRMAYEIHQGV